MLVIGRVELVLDDNNMVLIARHDVSAEGANALLGPHELQVQPDGLAEQAEIFLAREPWGEIPSLVSPVAANADCL